MPKNVRTIAPEAREDVLVRLRRIEGQVRGIQRMVEDERSCREIVNQIAAIKAAISSLNSVVVECYARDCLGDADTPRDETVAELIDVVLKAAR
jgi:DNA-binding FrmR family transcriptional regulator